MSSEDKWGIVNKNIKKMKEKEIRIEKENVENGRKISYGK